MNPISQGNYLYVINYQNNEEGLCSLEMQSLFKIAIRKKWFVSTIEINPSRSVFIKYRISVLFTGETIEDIENYVKINPLLCSRIKFVYVNIDKNKIEYSIWKTLVARICCALNITENHDNPEILLGIIRINDTWVFGTCVKNDSDWTYHDYKPNTNSHSLGIRIARSVVNIAVEDNKDLSIVDPCCGIGTVVIEAASMGLRIRGYEINRKVAESAKENLTFFGISNVIECNDMHKITDHFDVSIVDMPYGLFTAVSLTGQTEITETARRISNKSILITGENMDGVITKAGFNIKHQCLLSKGKFTRYITVCS